MKTIISELIDRIRVYGLEYFGKYYSIYRGTVEDNIDPENRGRVWVKVPQIADDQVLAHQAYPIVPFAGANHGSFFPPVIGEKIYVVFENGDTRFPLYYGGWWASPGGTPEIPPEFKQADPTTESPVKRGIKTPGGHYLLFDDTAGKEKVLLAHKTGAYVNIDENGNVLLQNAAGSFVNMDAKNGELSVVDAAGNSIRLSADGIELTANNQNFMGLIQDLVQIVSQKAMTIQAADINLAAAGVSIGSGAVDFAVKGTSWIAYFAQLIQWMTSHTHPTGTGASGPPIVPPTPAPATVLSKNVKIL